MKYTCLHPDELSRDQLAAWDKLQRNDAGFDSPFFSPYFTLAVAEARKDVRVTILEDGDRLGFFPFQASNWGIGRAVGWRLNDFQGVIAPPEFAIDAQQLLAASRLRTWRFDHLMSTDEVARSAELHQRKSPVIDLHQGFAAYCQARKQAGSDAISQTWRKERKLARDVDEVRLEVHSSDEEVMSCLVAWKTAQLRRNGSLSIFEVGWMLRAIEALRHSQAEGCRGQLSALYAGKQVVAVHLGLRNARVLHWWITTYNPEFEAYSPGSILLLRLAEAAARENVQRIDLGKGDEVYKQRFMTSVSLVGEGTLCSSPMAQQWCRAVDCVRQYARTSPLRGTLRGIQRAAQGMIIAREAK